MRVFLDTNILVSALASRGLCADVLREVLVAHNLILSAPLLQELQQVLRSKIGLPQELISEFIEILQQDSTQVEHGEPLDQLCGEHSPAEQ